MKSCRSFVVGEEVFAEDFSNSSEKWIPGVISKVTGPLSFQIDLSNGKTVRRHVDNVRKRVVKKKGNEVKTPPEKKWCGEMHSCQLSRFCRDSPGFLSLSPIPPGLLSCNWDSYIGIVT